MFGIPDPGIWLAYLLAFGCLIFSIVYGIIYWDKDKSKNSKDNTER